MTESISDVAYELRNVSKAYELGGRDIHAVREVSLTIAAGEFVAVAGPSGSGKTTLLQLLGALDRPSSGEILFEGRDIVALADGSPIDGLYAAGIAAGGLEGGPQIGYVAGLARCGVTALLSAEHIASQGK